jgi:hypothetical protein
MTLIFWYIFILYRCRWPWYFGIYLSYIGADDLDILIYTSCLGEDDLDDYDVIDQNPPPSDNSKSLYFNKNEILQCLWGYIVNRWTFCTKGSSSDDEIYDRAGEPPEPVYSFVRHHSTHSASSSGRPSITCAYTGPKEAWLVLIAAVLSFWIATLYMYTLLFRAVFTLVPIAL